MVPEPVAVKVAVEPAHLDKLAAVLVFTGAAGPLLTVTILVAVPLEQEPDPATV